VYNLPRTDAIYQQFNGIVGAAYFVAGLGVTALTSGDEGSCEIVRNPSLKRKPNVRRRLTALQGKVAAVEELQHRCYRLTDLRKCRGRSKQGPWMTRWETARYTQLLANAKPASSSCGLPSFRQER
jgi:hypothetical protein